MRLGKQPAVAIHNPPERAASPVRQPSQYPTADDSSSYYSQDSAGERLPSCISPLRIQKDNEPRHLSILQEYTDKRNSVRGSGRAPEELERRATPDKVSSGAELAYTPLAPFLPQGAPTVRKASKTLIGEGGWLENTSKPEQNGSPTRGGNFLGNLVKKAKEMASKPTVRPLNRMLTPPRSKPTRTTARSASPASPTTRPARPHASWPSRSARASRASSTASSSSPSQQPSTTTSRRSSRRAGSRRTASKRSPRTGSARAGPR
jgi:hypothetical protein